MNNPPAFPSGNDVTLGDWRSHGHSGMTLRDYFAAKALQGICARGPEPSWTHARSAAEAYDLANAMMKARNSIWQNAITKEKES